MPRHKGMINTDDVETTAPPELGGEVDVEDIEVIPGFRMRDKAEQAKFMNEYVVIEIENDPDPNAPLFVHSGHSGVDQYIQRGTPQRVKRRFLYALLAAKKKSFTCSFGKDNSGVEFNRMNGQSATTHRLHVVEDKNPRAREWFESVMKEA